MGLLWGEVEDKGASAPIRPGDRAEVRRCGHRTSGCRPRAGVRRRATSTSSDTFDRSRRRQGPHRPARRPAARRLRRPRLARRPTGGCLAVWTQPQLRRRPATRSRSRRSAGTHARPAPLEVFRRSTCMVTIDGQGRLGLPARLRERRRHRRPGLEGHRRRPGRPPRSCAAPTATTVPTPSSTTTSWTSSSNR